MRSSRPARAAALNGRSGERLGRAGGLDSPRRPARCRRPHPGAAGRTRATKRSEGAGDRPCRILRAAVAAVTRGAAFLEQPTIGGRVLWVGEEAVGDVKGQLAELDADLDQVFFIRRLNPEPKHATSLPQLIALLRPVWVIIDTWQHHLKTHRVTDTAGPGEQGILIGDVVDLAQQYEVAITVSHHNTKNRPEYRDSTALGAAVDWIVSLTRGDTPTARRLQPSGRWPVDPVEIRWQRDVGYEVVADAGEAEPSNRQQSAEPIDERVLLHLLELDPDARQSARVLAAGLRCQGRRYNELSETLHRLVADEFVDHDQRPGTPNSRDRGYALTQEGRLRAASLRAAADSRVCAKKTEEAATVSEPGPPGWPETETEPRRPRRYGKGSPGTPKLTTSQMVDVTRIYESDEPETAFPKTVEVAGALALEDLGSG